MKSIEVGKQVFITEIEALQMVEGTLDDTFDRIVNRIVECEGKVMITGMGKSGHIAKKIAATFASLGIPAFYIHPAEARHGDLGMVEKKDIIIMLSNSGNTDEIVSLIQNIKIIGAGIIGVTSGEDSVLAKHCDLCQILPKVEEACLLKLAPTSSTTVQLVYGDALAVAASNQKGIDKNTFALYHPAGALGKRLLLRVEDAMKSLDDTAVIALHSSFQEAIAEMCGKESRLISIINDEQKLAGVITDGDIRRTLEKTDNVKDININEIMTRHPICMKRDMLLIQAFIIMREKNISGFPVVDEDGILCGCIEYNDVMRMGIG